MDWVVTAEQNAVYKMDLSGGQRRLKEAILYVCKNSRTMDRFGAIKLNKILWRSDFRSYFDRRIPVTGRQYQRLRLGPAPVEMAPIVNEMLRDQLIQIELRPIGRHTERRHIALVEANLSLFSSEDIAYLDESIAHYWDMTGAETSDESHGIAWKSREDGDPMPYQSSYFNDALLPPDILGRLTSIGRGKGWQSK